MPQIDGKERNVMTLVWDTTSETTKQTVRDRKTERERKRETDKTDSNR